MTDADRPEFAKARDGRTVDRVRAEDVVELDDGSGRAVWFCPIDDCEDAIEAGTWGETYTAAGKHLGGHDAMTNDPTPITSSKANEDPQAGFFDVEWEDSVLETAYREQLMFDVAYEQFLDGWRGESGRKPSQIKKAITEGEERNGLAALEDGVRVRCGEFVFRTQARSGGGFDIPDWEKTGRRRGTLSEISEATD